MSWVGPKKLMSSAGSIGARSWSCVWLVTNWMGSIDMGACGGGIVLVGLGVFGMGGGGPRLRSGSVGSSRRLLPRVCVGVWDSGVSLTYERVGE